MMHAVAAGLDQSEGVMPRVDVKEVGAKRLLHVVGKPEAEQVDVERHHRVDVFDRQHGVAKTERAGSETGNRTARTERRVVDFRAVKYLQTIAGRIAKRNQAANAPVVAERLRLGGNTNPALFPPRGCRPPPAARPARSRTAASRRARPIRTRHIPEPAQPLRVSRFFSDLGLNLSIFCSFEHRKMWPKPTTPGRPPRS